MLTDHGRSHGHRTWYRGARLGLLFGWLGTRGTRGCRCADADISTVRCLRVANSSARSITTSSCSSWATLAIFVVRSTISMRGNCTKTPWFSIPLDRYKTRTQHCSVTHVHDTSLLNLVSKQHAKQVQRWNIHTSKLTGEPTNYLDLTVHMLCTRLYMYSCIRSI